MTPILPVLARRVPAVALRLPRLAYGFAAMAMLMLLVAGGTKLLNLPLFVEHLRAWRSMPRWLLGLVSAGVPIAEVCLAMMWFIGYRMRLTSLAAIVFLVVVSGAYGWESIRHAPPKCGCMGGWGAEVWLDQPLVVMSRNILMIVFLSVSAWFPMASDSIAPLAQSARRTATPRSCPPDRGFTLVEMLVVMATVAILVALLLLALGTAKSRAVDAKQLAILRGHAAVMSMYQSDCRGAFPFLADVRQERTVIECQALELSFAIRPFDAWQWWHVGLADAYYGGQAMSPTFRWRDSPGQATIRTSILYPITFLARPEYWNFDTRTALARQIGATRDSDVYSPSKKILLVEWATQSSRSGANPHQALSFVDGHAANMPLRDLLPRAPHERAWPRYSSYPTLSTFPAFYTLDGVRGRDFK